MKLGNRVSTIPFIFHFLSILTTFFFLNTNFTNLTNFISAKIIR